MPYHLTLLDVPSEILLYICKFRLQYLKLLIGPFAQAHISICRTWLL